MSEVYTPGKLVHLRNRDWVVMPSSDPDLLMVKPLGGSEKEVTAIYRPLLFENERVRETEFPSPTAEDIGDIGSAKLLLNASRLSFRNAAGPFRCIGRLSFRPRAYQMVPLVMALKQEYIRLMIADDVGIGKTIESLLIVKELIERREIDRFAVVCPPHLCEQWQAELKEKFNIDAVIIRSNTQATLDRKIHNDESVFQFYPFQVISIDYIKSEQRRQLFIHECPELLIVDEVHTCAKPAGADRNRQQRHSLIHAISKKEKQHLLLLTATPHSGKKEEFQSLLGLLNPKFEGIDLPSATTDQRKEIAQHFVQRKRKDVENWMGEETHFPVRESKEFDYDLSNEYKTFFLNEFLPFTQKLVSGKTASKARQRVHYWTALGLLRGVMSSPAAGVKMLENRLDKITVNDEDIRVDNPVLDDNQAGFENDLTPTQLTQKTLWSDYQKKQLREFSKKLESFKNLDQDHKALSTEWILEEWLKEGFHPVVFCRYIETAKYLGKILKVSLEKKIKGLDVQVITSEDPDEIRKERIQQMKNNREEGKTKKSLLIATDCLSEGINLQEVFTAALHYDLPWNPNRLEQREGRVDRFGQAAKTVKTMILYGKDNPIDGIVFKVILEKVREIKKTTGFAVPFPDDSESVLDTILHSVLLDPEKARKWVQNKSQLTLGFEFDEADDIEKRLSNELEKATERERVSRSIFKQHSIKAQEIETDLKLADEAIGSPQAVKEFITGTLPQIFGAQIQQVKEGWRISTTNLPEELKQLLPEGKGVKATFESPQPEGYIYLGRNHPFVEQVANTLLGHSMIGEGRYRAARASVIRSDQVDIQHNLMILRVRNVIESKRKSQKIVAEEMIVWGFKGSLENPDPLTEEQTYEFLENIVPTSDLPEAARARRLSEITENLNQLQPTFDKMVEERCIQLTEAHERYRKLMGGNSFEVVYPVQPMDILGVYVVLPDVTLN